MTFKKGDSVRGRVFVSWLGCVVDTWSKPDTYIVQWQHDPPGCVAIEEAKALQLSIIGPKELADADQLQEEAAPQ